ncbi:MAG: hypothetical protein IH586_13390 [Anaerolineaceae bacterium]|nr:hypothetical protein [Anaerolineaceae bacterium]
MKCSSCDGELVPGARFCDACGAPVEDAAAQPRVRVDPAARIEPAAQTEPGQPPSPYDAFSAAPASPPSQAPAAAYTPPGGGYSNMYSDASSAAPSGEKILGMPAEQMGTIALGLGGAGCLFSVVGCGGLISVLGLIAGFLALKTTGKRNATIGLVLSGLGIIVTLIMLCGFLFFFLQASGNNGY